MRIKCDNQGNAISVEIDSLVTGNEETDLETLVQFAIDFTLRYGYSVSYLGGLVAEEANNR